VVEEADARVDDAVAIAIEVEDELDARFVLRSTVAVRMLMLSPP